MVTFICPSAETDNFFLLQNKEKSTTTRPLSSWQIDAANVVGLVVVKVAKSQRVFSIWSHFSKGDLNYILISVHQLILGTKYGPSVYLEVVSKCQYYFKWDITKLHLEGRWCTALPPYLMLLYFKVICKKNKLGGAIYKLHRPVESTI